MTSTKKALLVAMLASATLSPQAAQRVQGQDGTDGQAPGQSAVSMADELYMDAPPLPIHGQRSAPSPSQSRPASTGVDRGEANDPGPVLNSGTRLPIPGQPARDLLPPGEADPVEAAAAGIFSCIPHSTPNGGIIAEVIYALAHDWWTAEK